MVSIVVPVYNEALVLAALHAQISSVMRSVGVEFELLLVNDGSRDGSLELMHALREADPRVSVLSLSRNFGHQAAITAGIEHAVGDAVVVMDADLQDPPEVVLEMLQKWREGNDVVYAVRTRREGEGAFKRGTASLFYRLLRAFTSVDIPADTGDFRLMSRRAVEALRRLPERHRFVRGLVAWVGFRSTAVHYERRARLAGETKYPLRKMVRFACDGLLSFSSIPLRLATWVGLTVSALSFVYGAWAIYERLVLDRTIQGWASLMVAVAFLGGVQLVGIGILGAYVGRIYDEVKNRPLYLVDHLLQGRQIPDHTHASNGHAAVA